jgi:hypothetical protein
MENGSHAPEMPAPEASQQILDAFSNLAPLFRDNTLMLEPNPRETKTRRRDPPQKPEDLPKNRGTGPRETTEQTKLLLALAHLAIKHDQELQSMRKQDQFILFLSSEATGAFHLMLQETANWKKLMDSPTPGPHPLRQHLILCLVKSLRLRAEQIVNAPETDQLFQVSLQKSTERIDPTRSQLPIPQVGSEHPKADSGQEDSGQCQADGTTAGGDLGTAPGHPVGDTLSCTEGTSAKSDLHSVAPATECQARQGLRDFPPSLLQRGVDGGGSFNEATQPGTKQSCHTNPESLAGQPETGQGQRQSLSTPTATMNCTRFKLSQVLCRLIMNNDSTWCYANCIVFSLMWTWLCAPSSTDLWGCRFAELLQYFCQLDSRWVVLAEAPWFQQILRAWGPAHGQNDSAEFTQAVLAWLGMKSFDMRWERRVLVGTTTQVFDSSCGHAPIILTITPSMHDSGTCNLTNMIQNWCQENSMTAALLEAPICLVLQIDRLFQDATGTILKSMSMVTLDAEVQIPVFQEKTPRLDPVAYTPVAGITHFGADLAGHCQAILKLQPGILSEVTPISWLITEDAREPEPIWRIPDHFAQNITVVWLVRSDILSLQVYNQPASAETNDIQPHGNLLNLLQAQEGIE